MSVSLSSVARAALIASVTTVALLLPGSAYAGEDPADVDPSAAPENVTVAVATSNGSGCPGNTAEVTVLPRTSGFTVTYHDEYLARSGIGADPTDFRKNCQVNLAVDYPDGFTFAIVAASHSGFANLERGASGLQRWLHYFQGSSTTRIADHRFTGPFRDNWQTFDRLGAAERLWAPCDERRNLNVNTELRVTAGASDPNTASLMAPDWTDDTADATYRFLWRRCG